MEHQMFNTGFSLTPIGLIICGAIIRYIIGRRRFNRRGIGGLQQYGSYWAALLTTVIEWMFKWAANILILVGIASLIINF